MRNLVTLKRLTGLFILSGVLSGCLVGPKVTNGERVELFEGDYWCELKTSEPDFINECRKFIWSGSHYLSGDKQISKRTPDELVPWHVERLPGDRPFFLIETYSWDAHNPTKVPKNGWRKILGYMEDGNSNRVHITAEDDEFDGKKRAAEAAGIRLSAAGDTSLEGTREAIRVFFQQMAKNWKAHDGKWFYRVADPQAPLSSIIQGMKGTPQAREVAHEFCREARWRGESESKPKDKEERKAYWRRIVVAADTCEAIARPSHQGLLWRSVARRNLGQYEPAERDLTQLLTDYDVNLGFRLSVHMDRADVRMKRKNYHGAIVDYETVLKSEPENIYAHNLKGVALRRLEDYPGAIRSYSEAIKYAAQKGIKDELAVAYMRRGYVYLLQDNLSGAEKDSRAAIKLDGNLSYAHSNLGQVHERRGEHGEAKAAYRAALALWAGNPHAREGMDRIEKGKPRSQANESTSTTASGEAEILFKVMVTQIKLALQQSDRELGTNAVIDAHQKLMTIADQVPHEFWYEAGTVLLKRDMPEPAELYIETYLDTAGKSAKNYKQAVKIYSDLVKSK